MPDVQALTQMINHVSIYAVKYGALMYTYVYLTQDKGPFKCYVTQVGGVSFSGKKSVTMV